MDPMSSEGKRLNVGMSGKRPLPEHPRAEMNIYESLENLSKNSARDNLRNERMEREEGRHGIAYSTGRK